jgi:hypothetical protein
MPHQNSWLGNTHLTGLDSTLPVCTHSSTAIIDKPNNLCRVFLSQTGPHWPLFVGTHTYPVGGIWKSKALFSLAVNLRTLRATIIISKTLLHSVTHAQYNMNSVSCCYAQHTVTALLLASRSALAQFQNVLSMNWLATEMYAYQHQRGSRLYNCR